MQIFHKIQKLKFIDAALKDIDIYKAMKVRVVSGDTIKCFIDLGFNVSLQSMRVKLLNLKAPTGIAGDKAKAHLDSILPEKFSIKTRIEDGIIIADVMSGGESINQKMLDSGMCEKFTKDEQ